MTTLALDTYQFIQTLTKAGMPETQAKALVQELQQVNLRDVATAADITDLKVKIEQVKTDMLKWLIPLLLGQVAVFAALVKWLLT